MPSLSSGKKTGRTPRASSTRKRRRASLVPELSVLPANSKEPVSARSAPQARGVSMLLVGIKGSGKVALAAGLRSHLAARPDIDLEIRVAESLPLPADPGRPRIDFVVFFIDLTNATSLLATRESLRHLDPGFAEGRAGIVVTGAGEPTKHMLALGDAHAVRADAALSLAPLSLPSIGTPDAAARVWRWADTASHGRAGISPMLLATADVRFVTQTTT